MPKPQNEIVIQVAAPRVGVPRGDSLRRWALAALPKTPCGLTIRIVASREGRALNRRWRGKDKPTNVLSFPNSESIRYPLSAIRLLGDLVICAPVVAREAREQGKLLNAHWAHMVVHGVLHLQGYDHVKNRDAIRMETREVEILAGFGYQDPYALQEGR